MLNIVFSILHYAEIHCGGACVERFLHSVVIHGDVTSSHTPVVWE